MSNSQVCEICEEEKHRQAHFCKRCRKLINRGNRRTQVDKKARVQALKIAWDGKGFRCYFSGIRLVEDNSKDPRYLTFDHLTPRQKSDIVVAAAVINDMKSDMSENEFKAMVIQLANRFRGGTFKENTFNLKHWKR